MTRSRLAATLLAAFAVFATTPESDAFTPRTRAEIVRRALTLMPDGLQRQLKKHARSLFEGALAPAGQGDPRQCAALAPGDADAALERTVRTTSEAIEEREAMSRVARRFGEMAALSADLSFALNVGPAHPRESEIYLDYAAYVERKLPRMSVTFSGFGDPHLARGNVREYAQNVGTLARRDYDGILRSYFPEGRERLPQDFDERSVAFAAASLEVSLAVTATARIWLYTWHRANGDLAGTPLLPAGGDPFAPAAPSPAAQSRPEKK